jgi:hypothetical protein
MKTRVNLPFSDSLRRVSIKPSALKKSMVLSRSLTCFCLGGAKNIIRVPSLVDGLKAEHDSTQLLLFGQQCTLTRARPRTRSMVCRKVRSPSPGFRLL